MHKRTHRIVAGSLPALALSSATALAHLTGSAVQAPATYSAQPPAAGGSHSDAVFGTSIKRVSNATLPASGGPLSLITNEYSTMSPFNNDSSRLILQHVAYYGLYDGDGNYLRDLPFAVHASSEPRWSRSNASLLYFVNGNQLKSLHVETNSVAVVHTFAEYAKISGKGESDICFDGNHFVFAGDDRYVFVYEIGSDSKGPVLDTGGRGFDSLYITPDDNVLISWLAVGTNRYNGIELFDRSMTFGRQITRAGGHMDVGRDTNGQEVLLWVNAADPQPVCDNGIVKVRLADGQQTCLVSFDWSLATHTSAPDGNGWVFVETYAPADPNPASASWKPYTNEIVQVKLDGTEVRRLAHHRSRPSDDYYYQPRVSTNRSGTKLVFSSNFGLQSVLGLPSLYTDVYMITVPASSPTPTPTPTPVPAGANLSAPAVTSPVANSTIGVAGVTFRWSALSGAAGYDIRVLDSGTGAVVFSGSLVGGSSTSTLLALPSGPYTFGIRACTAAGFGDASCGPFAAISFAVDLVTPAGTPAVLSPASGANLTAATQVLSWSPVAPNPLLPTMTYEVVVRDLARQQTALHINVPHPSTSTVFSLQSSASYDIRVRACQAACGPFSAPASFSVALSAVPTTAPAITSAPLNGSELTLNWTPVPGAELYQVQVVQPGAGPGGGALTVAARQVSVTTATLRIPSGGASLLLRACSGDGCGPLGAPVAIAGPSTNPSTPSLGSPMAGTIASGPVVSFSWSRVPGDTGSNTVYRLFVQDLSRQAAALDVYTRDNFYAAYLNAEGTRYDAIVIASPGPNQVVGPASGFSVSGTSASAPTLVQPAHQSTVAQGNVQLGWSPVAGATLYEYFVAIQGQGQAIVRGVTPGVFVQVPLAAAAGSGTVYSGIVRACAAGATCVPGNDAGWGAWSNQAGPGVTNFTVTP